MSQQSVAENAPGSPILRFLPPRFRDPKKIKDNLDIWAAKQPVAIDAAVATLGGSFQGFCIGGLFGALLQSDPSKLADAASQSGQSADLLKSMHAQMGGPWVQARNIAVITGVHAGIAQAMKRIRKKDDTYTAMVAAFGSGSCYSLVSGITQGNRFQGAFTTGVMFALLQGAIQRIQKKFSTPKRDPLEYSRARHLLTNLGFPEYTKNIQKGRLNDYTIWLWNDSTLQEARIPPGPRLLILNHVDRYRNVLKPPHPPPRPSLSQGPPPSEAH